MDTLKREVVRYQRSDPYVPLIHRQGEVDDATRASGHDWVTVQICAWNTKPVPIELPAVAGDFVHNLRSALDYLAWQLVLLDDGRPTTETTFPIRAVRPSGRQPNPGLIKPEIRRKDILALLDGVQPYAGANGDRSRVDAESTALYVLNDLDRIDKHRHLNVVSATAAGGRVVLTLPDGRIIEREGLFHFKVGSGWQRFPLKDGAPLMSFGFSETGDVSNAEVHVDCQIPVDVVLGESWALGRNVLPLTERLQSLLDCVREDVVPLFSPLF